MNKVTLFRESYLVTKFSHMYVTIFVTKTFSHINVNVSDAILLLFILSQYSYISVTFLLLQQLVTILSKFCRNIVTNTFVTIFHNNINNFL